MKRSLDERGNFFLLFDIFATMVTLYYSFMVNSSPSIFFPNFTKFVISVSVQETEIPSGVGIPVIKEPEAEEVVDELDKDSDDSKSSTSTELCDEPDRLSDFDSEEPTSISDASSYAPAASEQVVMKIPSPVKSGLPTPEVISPMKDEVPVKDQVSPICEIKHPDKLSPGHFVEKPISDIIDVSPEFVSTAVSPMDKSLSPIQQLPVQSYTPEILQPDIEDNFSMNTETDDLFIKSPLTEEDELKNVQREDIQVTDSFVLKLTSPLNESATFKKELISPHLIEDIPLKEDIADISFKENITLSPQFSKNIIPVSPGSPETFSLKSPEKSDSEIEESSSLLVKEISSIRSYSPISGEVKTISEQDFTNEETITEELLDSNLMKIESISFEDLEKLDSDPSYNRQFPILSPMSDISPLVEETAKIKLIDWSYISPIKTHAVSMKKSTSSVDMTKSKSGTLQNAKSFQDLKDISPTKHVGRISPLYGDNKATRTSDIFRIGDTQEESSGKENLTAEILVPDIEVTCIKMEALNDDVENVSGLTEGSHKLHEGVPSVEEDNRDETNKLENAIDYAEMTDLLELDSNISLGRRNSERALQIIQENSEILQRIMLCQARRPSKLSEEGSNGGTATIPSEVESIPTSSSAENVDITVCQTADITTDENNIPARTSVSPNETVVVKDLDKVPIVSSFPPSEIVVTNEEIIVVSPEKQLTPSEDTSSKSWHKRDSMVKEETAEKIEILARVESPYSLFFTHDESSAIVKPDISQTADVTSTHSFTISPEITKKEEHRFSLDYGDMKFSKDSSDTKAHRFSSDDTFSSYFEGKPKYTSSFDEAYKEIKSQKFELDSDRVSTSKRFDTLDSSLSENTSSQFPKRYSPEPTVQHPYSSISSKSTKNSLDFFDKPLITGSETRTLSSSGLRWTDDDDGEYKSEKRITASRESPTLFESTIPKYSYDSPSSSSWLTEKSRRERETSPVKSFETRPISHYSSRSPELISSKPYTSTGRYDYSFTKSETRSTEAETSYFSSDVSKIRDSHSPISTRDSSSRPLESFSFKTSSERSEKSSIDDYQPKLSYSPTRRYTDDFVPSIHSHTSSTVEFTSSTQDVTRRTTARDHTRPHSTIISDLASMEVLNRSYSSSSIDGYLSRSRLDLTTSEPSGSGKSSLSSSFKPILDETSISSDTTRSKLHSPIYELDSPKKTSPSSHYRHLSPRRDDFDSKISCRDSSPSRYSSFTDSKWDKDVYSSPSKSQYKKSSIDSDRLTTDSTSTTASTSLSSKLGKPYSPPTSPTKSSKDLHISLPPIKSSLGSPVKSKSKFDPFPPRPTTRQPKELGIKLGLYSSELSSKNGRTSGKRT